MTTQEFSELDEINLGAPSSHGWPLHDTALTKDAQGYVFWKGKSIEHYSFPDAESEKVAAHALQARCVRLEDNGWPVNGRTVVFAECYDAPEDTPWKDSFLRYYSFFERDNVVVGIFYRDDNSAAPVFSIHGEHGQPVVQEHEDAYTAFHTLQNAGMTPVKRESSYAGLLATLEALGLAPEQLAAEIFKKG